MRIPLSDSLYIRRIKKYRRTSIIFGSSLLLVIGGFLWAYIALKDIPQALIIHFTERAGINETGSVLNLGALAIVGIVAVIMNSVIAFELKARDNFLSVLVTFGTLFFSILIFIYFKVIISVNYL